MSVIMIVAVAPSREAKSFIMRMIEVEEIDIVEE
jgi:hypothetical protein